MKIYLITVVFFFTFILQLSGQTYSLEKNSEIPPEIEMFLKKHFAKYITEKFKYDPKDGECKVKYSNGYKVEFDKNGNWTEIKSSYEPLPKSIIDLLPKNALQYISRNYPRKMILGIKYKSSRYKVSLLNAPDLLFDKNGRFLEKD